jgi:hypothetical protein
MACSLHYLDRGVTFSPFSGDEDMPEIVESKVLNPCFLACLCEDFPYVFNRLVIMGEDKIMM